MSSNIESMMRLILEEQERGRAWHAARYQEECQPDWHYGPQAYEPSTSYQEYAQGNQYGYGERFQSSKEMLPNAIGEVLEKNAQINDEFNLEAEEFIKEFEFHLGCTVDENLAIRYEDQVEPVAIMSNPTKSNEKVVGVGGKTFEDPCEDGLVVECIRITRESTTQNELSTMEEMHKQPDSKQESYGEKLMEEQEIIIEKASEENEKEESPSTQHFDKHLGILPTTPLSFHGPRKTPFEKVKMKKFRDWFNDSPRKIPFEEIRMNEFRGWFYDEYDPGDPSSPSLPPKPTSTVKLKRR